MCFEECDEADEKLRIARLLPKLLCPDSGQVEEPLRPPLVPERCRERGEGNSRGIIWC